MEPFIKYVFEVTQVVEGEIVIYKDVLTFKNDFHFFDALRNYWADFKNVYGVQSELILNENRVQFKSKIDSGTYEIWTKLN